MYQLLINDPAHGLVVRTNHVLFVVAVTVCCWHAIRRLRRIDGLDWYRARWGFLFLAVVPWIGGHVHFLINNWSFAAHHPAWLFLPWMGLHAGGVIISLAISIPPVFRYCDVPVGRVADALVPTVGIGIF